MVVAHPDDEVLGAGGQFSSMRRLTLIHLTDGAPSRRAARWHGFPTRKAYAETRWRELDCALRTAGVEPDRVALRMPDQQASFHLAAAAEQLAVVLSGLRPDLVLTHPYEGGHPDHDAAAFVTTSALLLAASAIPLWEFTSYHADDGAMVTGRFLRGDADPPAACVHLTDDERATKLRMLACFGTQHDVLAAFPAGIERFRRAPAYDFSRPPHAGRLLYESRRRAWTGAHWRRLARAATATLDRRRPRRLASKLTQAAYARVREHVWRLWLAI